MARSYGNTGIPIDKPVVLEPGVMQKESDAPGNSKHIALAPEHPARAAKGDLGLSVIQDFESRPLSHPGVPFTDLKSGR